VREIRCFGCGGLVPDLDGPVHAYMLASPGCWALYAALEDWKAGLPGSDRPTLAQYLTDSYAAQHPANPDRRNRQSVAIHLMSLCASLESGVPGERLRYLLGTWAGRDYPLLTPQPEAYELTARDVALAEAEERADLVLALARGSWASWSAHHGQVREWLGKRSGS
jgi:hypothetical protein